jgi:hypothetical protein
LYNYMILTRDVPKRIGEMRQGDTPMIEITRKDMGA